ncbi:hypothetical protein BD560DRAFT_488323 [Blakeslea trispora]|nr:hypothetical protein BD560DRAFT_488323 [Blakeslea trispora]
MEDSDLIELEGVVDGRPLDRTDHLDRDKKYVVMLIQWSANIASLTEIIEFNDAIDKFYQLDSDVVAFSCLSVDMLCKLVDTPREQGGLGKETKMCIMSDPQNAIIGTLSDLLQISGGLCIYDGENEIRSLTFTDVKHERSVAKALNILKSIQLQDMLLDEEKRLARK